MVHFSGTRRLKTKNKDIAILCSWFRVKNTQSDTQYFDITLKKDQKD